MNETKYFQMVASLYIVMVVLVVGMNYKLKERKQRKVDHGEGREMEGTKLIKSSSVSFTEGRGAFSTLVSATSKQCGTKVYV